MRHTVCQAEPPGYVYSLGSRLKNQPPAAGSFGKGLSSLRTKLPTSGARLSRERTQDAGTESHKRVLAQICIPKYATGRLALEQVGWHMAHCHSLNYDREVLLFRISQCSPKSYAHYALLAL